MVMALHQTRHEGQVEFRVDAAGVGQRKDRHVELAATGRLPLLARLEQTLGREDLDRQIDSGFLDMGLDDLGHLVPNVRGRPLVRQPQRGLGLGLSGQTAGCEQSRRGGTGKKLAHGPPFPLREAHRLERSLRPLAHGGWCSVS